MSPILIAVLFLLIVYAITVLFNSQYKCNRKQREGLTPSNNSINEGSYQILNSNYRPAIYMYGGSDSNIYTSGGGLSVPTGTSWYIAPIDSTSNMYYIYNERENAYLTDNLDGTVSLNSNLTQNGYWNIVKNSDNTIYIGNNSGNGYISTQGNHTKVLLSGTIGSQNQWSIISV
jgi:hypothetical protein